MEKKKYEETEDYEKRGLNSSEGAAALLGFEDFHKYKSTHKLMY